MANTLKKFNEVYAKIIAEETEARDYVEVSLPCVGTEADIASWKAFAKEVGAEEEVIENKYNSDDTAIIKGPKEAVAKVIRDGWLDSTDEELCETYDPDNYQGLWDILGVPFKG